MHSLRPSLGKFTDNSLCYDKIRPCAPHMDIILGRTINTSRWILFSYVKIQLQFDFL